MVASVEATAVARPAAPPDPLEPVLADYPPASSELLVRRSLLSRIDSKFVVPLTSLEEILDGLGDHYAVLRVERGPLAIYDSLYFDTSTLRCFHDHHHGRRIRHKIRIRHYPDRQLTFLEIKTKGTASKTIKQRRPMPYGEETLGPDELAFLRAHVGDIADDLHPELTISYRRLSLIGLDSDERVTIDLGLSADGEAGPIVASTLGHLAVIEIKQWPFCVRTPIMRAVRGAGHRRMSMSKYVVSLALTRPDLRCNRLRPVLRTLERI
jgi:hypothetical protein